MKKDAVLFCVFDPLWIPVASKYDIITHIDNLVIVKTARGWLGSVILKK